MNNSPITHIVVHASAEPHGRPTRARDIDRWHRQRGFRKIGYHYVIGTDGLVETGRAESEIGAHVSGHNKGTVGICLIGGLDPKTNLPSPNFAPIQYSALYRVVADLKSRFPDAEVLGHRDFPGVSKACPCFDARGWWAAAQAGEATIARSRKND